jgi:hypothetical protein
LAIVTAGEHAARALPTDDVTATKTVGEARAVAAEPGVVEQAICPRARSS